MDWFKIGKGVWRGVLSFCLCAVYIMRNAGLDESQARITVSQRNINNLRYADDATLMAESEEELKRASWWGWKRRVKKTGLKCNIQNIKIMASGPIISWQMEGGKVEAVTDFIFLDSNITVDDGSTATKLRHLLLGRKAMMNLNNILKSRDVTLLKRSV